MRLSLALLLPRSRRASRWSSSPAPRRARAPAASTPHAHVAVARFGRPFSRTPFSHARTRTHAPAHTHAQEAASRNLAAPARTTDERTMRRAVRRSGWLDHCTMGEHGAYAHRCGGPLSSRPLSPLPCNTAAPKGPAFCFLNYYNAHGTCSRGRRAADPPAFRRRSAPVPRPFRTRSAPVPHRCRTGAAPVPNRCRTGAAAVPQRIRTGARKQPGRRKKLGVFPRLFWCFCCALGGAFVFFWGVFCQKTSRRTSAGVPHAIRTVLRTCSALAPHLLRTCAAVVPQLCRSCAALVPHLCRTCAALVPYLCRTCVALVPHLCRTCAALVCRTVGGSAARRVL